MSMFPKNIKPDGCVPTSSKCVIWQGPDIPFLKLCKGDSINEVIAGIANKICLIMEQMNPSNLDFSCLDLTDCPPKTFNELFQIIIEEICLLKQATSEPLTSENILDVEVGVAACIQGLAGGAFVPVDVAIAAIGQFVCNQKAEITQLNATISNITSKVSTLESTVNAITGG
jgi:hypothetical protein